MKTHQDYINEMKLFGDNFIRTNKVRATQGSKGSLKASISFFKNYDKALKKANDDLVSKANSLLKQAKSNKEIDHIKLQDDLQKVCHAKALAFVESVNKAFK